MKEDNLVIVFTLLICAFYIPLFVFMIKRKDMKRAKKKFFRGVISVFENCQEDKECVSQISLLYKRVSSKYNGITQEMRSTTDFMEDFLFTIDTIDAKDFKLSYDKEISKEFRQRVVNCINIMKQLQPFSSISSKEANLLNVIKQGIEMKNEELAINSLEQLADDIEIMEEGLRKQSNKNSNSFTLSIIGLVLTIFFGVVSIISMMYGQ